MLGAQHVRLLSYDAWVTTSPVGAPALPRPALRPRRRRRPRHRRVTAVRRARRGHRPGARAREPPQRGAADSVTLLRAAVPCRPHAAARSGATTATCAPTTTRRSTSTSTPPTDVTVRGLIGLVGLREEDERVVLPHEDVMPGPVADRTLLMRTTETNLEPILLVHAGTDALRAGYDAIAARLTRSPTSPPWTEARTGSGRSPSRPASTRSRRSWHRSRHSSPTGITATRPTSALQARSSADDADSPWATAWPCSSTGRRRRAARSGPSTASVAGTHPARRRGGRRRARRPFRGSPDRTRPTPAWAATRCHRARRRFVALRRHDAGPRCDAGAPLRSTRPCCTRCCCPPGTSPRSRSSYHHSLDQALQVTRRRARDRRRRAATDLAEVIAAAAHGSRLPRKSTSFAPKPRMGVVMRDLRDR